MTLRITNKIIFFITILSSFINSQTIESIRITGNKNFAESRYLDWININPGMRYSNDLKDSVAVRISRKLNDNGYFNHSVKTVNTTFSSDSMQVQLFIEVAEGNAALIDTISIEGLSGTDSSTVIRALNFLKEEVFDIARIENAFSLIIDEYEEKGFPFASIFIKSIYVNGDTTKPTVELNLKFDKGRKSVIDKVEIIGNNKTDDAVILRAARLFPPVVYSQEKIESIPKQLNRLRYFEPVNKPSFYFNPEEKGVLQITVQEKETNNFDGVVGYVPASDDESGYFTGFVNITLRNLFGTGRGLGLKWHKQERNSQELELNYLEPWIFGYPFNIEVGFFQRKQDTTYVQRTFQSSVEFLATEDISASFLFSSESVTPTDNADNIFTVYNSSIITTGGQLEVDDRDDLLSPTEGVYFSSIYKHSTKSINGPDRFITSDTKTETSLQRLELDFLYFLELFNRQIIFSGVHAREMRGELFEISDLYKLGGTNNLRGYRENQFLGNRIFWSNTEYRYLITRRTFAFLFFDTGYFLRNAVPERNVEEQSSFKYGYGLGLNLETGLGILGVSFALGQEDSFSQGKIHFGIVNQF